LEQDLQDYREFGDLRELENLKEGFKRE